jgi:hypothetical protein
MGRCGPRIRLKKDLVSAFVRHSAILALAVFIAAPMLSSLLPYLDSGADLRKRVEVLQQQSDRQAKELEVLRAKAAVPNGGGPTQHEKGPADVNRRLLELQEREADEGFAAQVRKAEAKNGAMINEISKAKEAEAKAEARVAEAKEAEEKAEAKAKKVAEAKLKDAAKAAKAKNEVQEEPSWAKTDWWARMKREESLGGGCGHWGHLRAVLSKDPRAEKLHSDPDIYRIPNFFSDEQCDKALAYAAERRAAAKEPAWCFEKSVPESVAEKAEATEALTFDDENPDHVSKDQLQSLFRCAPDVATGQAYAKKHGFLHAQSTAVMVQEGEDEFFDSLSAHLGTVGLLHDQAYHAGLVQYKKGESSKLQTDCASQRNLARCLTVHVYLSDVTSGGATAFPGLGVEVQPRKGDAIFFGIRNEPREGEPPSCNAKMAYKSNVVHEGEKHVYERHYYAACIRARSGQEANVNLCDRSAHATNKDDLQISCRHHLFHEKRYEAEAIAQAAMRDKTLEKESPKVIEEILKALQIWPLHNQVSTWSVYC